MTALGSPNRLTNAEPPALVCTYDYCRACKGPIIGYLKTERGIAGVCWDHCRQSDLALKRHRATPIGQPPESV